jgi:hypothetical protein
LCKSKIPQKREFTLLVTPFYFKFISDANDYNQKVYSEQDRFSFDYEGIILFTKWSSYGHDLTKANPSFSIIADYSNGENSKTSQVSERYPFGGSGTVFYSIDSIGSWEEILAGEIIKLENIYDSLEVENKQYYQVKDFSNNRGGGKGQKRIFWAKNVGRIRFETFNGEVWNLIDQHIIK